MALSEKTIREKILAGIWTIAPQSKKIRRNVLTTNDRNKWAGLFQTEPEDEDEEPIAYAYIVRRVRARADNKSLNDQMTFEILGFKSHALGTDATNSEDDFQAEIDQITDWLMGRDVENEPWEFEDEADEVSTIEVEFSPIGLIPSSELLHFGGGRLVVQITRCKE